MSGSSPEGPGSIVGRQIRKSGDKSRTPTRNGGAFDGFLGDRDMHGSTSSPPSRSDRRKTAKTTTDAGSVGKLQRGHSGNDEDHAEARAQGAGIPDNQMPTKNVPAAPISVHTA